MKYIYHYYACKQHRDGGTTQWDGIITCDNKIDTQTRYRQMKKHIRESDDVDGFVIKSLSLLHEENQS